MNILIVLTSHHQLGDTGRRTGFWLEELAAPYYVFQEAGMSLALASPSGGQPPMEPYSHEPMFQTADIRRFEADPVALAVLANTMKLADVSVKDFDAVFYPGGHGVLWDLAEDTDSIALIESAIREEKPVAVVCHASGVLRHVKGPDGLPLVHNKLVTGFSNSETEAVGLTDIVPFLVEDMLKDNGGLYSKADDWYPYVVSDGLLITGQNPGSAAAIAQELVEQLKMSLPVM